MIELQSRDGHQPPRIPCTSSLGSPVGEDDPQTLSPESQGCLEMVHEVWQERFF